MKKALSMCGLFLFLFQSVQGTEVIKREGRVEATFTCAELEGAATWSLVVLQDKASDKFWAQVKYEVVEYECDDVSDGGHVGMRCNQTGGAIKFSSPKFSIDSCEIKDENNVVCRNEKNSSSSIVIKPGLLSFALDMNGENGAQLTDLFNSVTTSSGKSLRVAGISSCKLK